jgi:hypothetical protein
MKKKFSGLRATGAVATAAAWKASRIMNETALSDAAPARVEAPADENGGSGSSSYCVMQIPCFNGHGERTGHYSASSYPGCSVKYTVAFALWLVLLSSCKTGDMRDGTVVIDLTEKQEIALSDVVDRIRIIPLIVPETDLLGHIKDLCFAGDTVYILDDLTASLWSFDLNTGRSIKRICHRGNGPNEYVNPAAITSDADRLYLLDLPTQHIISYDRELNPLETVSLTFPALDFIATEKGFFLQNSVGLETLKKVVHTDKKGIVLESCLPFSNTQNDTGEYTGGAGKCFMKTAEGNVLFSEAYSNRIYMIDKTGCSLSCQMDFMNDSPPSDANHIPNLLELSYALCDHFFVWGEGYIIGILKDWEHYYCFYKPAGDEQKTGKVRDGKDGLPFFPRWQSGETLVGSCLYGEIRKRELADKYMDMRFDGNKPEAEDLLLLLYDMTPP